MMCLATAAIGGTISTVSTLIVITRDEQRIRRDEQRVRRDAMNNIAPGSARPCRHHSEQSRAGADIEHLHSPEFAEINKEFAEMNNEFAEMNKVPISSTFTPVVVPAGAPAAPPLV